MKTIFAIGLENMINERNSFAQWAEDNCLKEEMRLTIADLHRGKPQALKDLATFLELATRRGGKEFSDNVLCTLAEALEKQSF
jgi:hypothetical protein